MFCSAATNALSTNARNTDAIKQKRVFARAVSSKNIFVHDDIASLAAGSRPWCGLKLIPEREEVVALPTGVREDYEAMYKNNEF